MSSFSPGFDVSRVRLVEYDIPFVTLHNKPEWLETADFEYQVAPTLRWQFFREEDEVIVEVDVEVRAMNEVTGSDIGSGKFKFVFFFEVDDLAASVSDVNGTLEVDNDLARLLVATSYSTARGLLIAKTQHSCLEDLILPVKAPEDLLEAIQS